RSVERGIGEQAPEVLHAHPLGLAEWVPGGEAQVEQREHRAEGEHGEADEVGRDDGPADEGVAQPEAPARRVPAGAVPASPAARAAGWWHGGRHHGISSSPRVWTGADRPVVGRHRWGATVTRAPRRRPAALPRRYRPRARRCRT